MPLSFLAEMFEAEYRKEEEGKSVTLTLKGGRSVQFAVGSIGCVIDDTMRAMYCEALFRDGELLVSAEWFARYLFNLCASVYEDVVYITDHHAELGRFMADLIRDILHGRERLVPLD